MLLGRDLASEISIWLTYHEMKNELRIFLDDPMLAPFRDYDRVLHARVWLAVQNNFYAEAITILRSHCFPTYGDDRKVLLQLWLNAHLLAEQASLKRNLTLTDVVRVRRRLGCAGDSDTMNAASGMCNRGPPNIGYPY